VRATRRMVSASMPHTRDISAGLNSLTCCLRFSKPSVCASTYWPIVELFLDDDVQHGIEQRHVGAGLELQHVRGVAFQRLAARIHDDEGAAFGHLLEKGGGDRVVLGRVRADHDHHLGVLGRR